MLTSGKVKYNPISCIIKIMKNPKYCKAQYKVMLISFRKYKQDSNVYKKLSTRFA